MQRKKQTKKQAAKGDGGATKAKKADTRVSRAKTAPIAKPSAIEAYMNRIGAERRNFRRWIVKEEGRDGYHRDVLIITLSRKDGIKLKPIPGFALTKEIAPTAAEEAAIDKEIQSANWPKSLPATKAQFDALAAKLKKEHGEEPILFPFWSEAGTNILFVQHRVYKPNRIDKDDFAWSLWNDGEWRPMEPDSELLPLYGLEALKSGWQVFLHEGAKAAHVVGQLTSIGRDPELVAARAACPWLNELKGINAVHLGWPGGAPNPHRIDWRPIQKLPPQIPITLVCDHDHSGENAARYISKVLNRRLWVIRFGNQFGKGFDLADPFPDDLYNMKGGVRVYKGPSFDDCLEPATWATKWLGKDIFELRPEFIEDWSFTNRPAAYVHRQRVHRRYSAEEFNSYIAPFSDVKDVAALLRKYLSARAETLVYEPDLPSGRITFEGAQVINIYEQSKIEPLEGDVGPWLDFLNYLVPDPVDRAHLMKWDATLVARPDIRMTYSVLLISETQGVGKTTHAEVLARLIGRHNCSYPSTEEAVDPKFTTWRLFKRLAIIGEIYAGHSAKAYNQLKQPLTDDWVRAEEKYERPYQVKNWIHAHASSNSRRALKLDDYDRRWLVPGMTEVAKPPEYWRGFYEWLDSPNALPAIAAWAAAYVEKHGPVLKGEIAPMSVAKQRAIEEGRGDGERLIFDLGEAILNFGKTEKNSIGKKVVVRRDHIRLWLQNQKARVNSRLYGENGERLLETAETITSILKRCGLVVPDRRFKSKGEWFRVVANFEADFDNVEWREIEKEGLLLEPGEIATTTETM